MNGCGLQKQKISPREEVNAFFSNQLGKIYRYMINPAWSGFLVVIVSWPTDSNQTNRYLTLTCAES
jgi:hypothetical protein